jgi:hypothetical protein
MATDEKIYYQAKPRESLLEPAVPGDHVWIAMAAFRVQPESLRGKPTDQVNLDSENLATITVGCYVCEQPWSDYLSYRKCTGEPKA